MVFKPTPLELTEFVNEFLRCGGDEGDRTLEQCRTPDLTQKPLQILVLSPISAPLVLVVFHK